MHAYTAALLWQRVLICLMLITPPGFMLGFCFPIGLRWMAAIHQEHNLPWMWALNGAAGTLGSFVAMLVSMETSIGNLCADGRSFLFAGCSGTSAAADGDESRRLKRLNTEIGNSHSKNLK